MHRLPIIIVFLAACAPVFGGKDINPSPRLVIGAEYRQDALDFDDVEKLFFRESSRLTSGKSSASFTHVNVGMTRDNRFTWNICLRGISPYFETIIGNYYANFGAGLLVGRKMALSPDLFTRSLAVSRGTSFTPCSSGNPYFSFQGIVAGAHYSWQTISFSLHGYYSFRNRFVRNDRQYPDITGTSLNSILMRTKKDYRYSEPVEINDCGYSFTIRFARVVTLQSYFIYTFIKRSNNHYLLWNFDTHMVPGGEKNFYGYGFYLQYRDDYILIFIDFCSPNRVLSTADGRSRTLRGYGIMYSLAFRHRGCSISFVGKQTDKSYYSPYSSGKNNPETACAAAVSVNPLRNLSIGAAFFVEKNNLPSRNEQYLRFTRREQVFLKYSSHLKGSLSIRLAFVEGGRKQGKEQHLRLSSSSRIYIMKSILFTLGGTMQHKGMKRYSGSIRAGMRFTLFNATTFQLSYARFFIASGAPLYTPTSRPADSISHSMSISSSSNILAGGIQARFTVCRLSLEYLHQFTGPRTLQSRIEASAYFFF